MFLNPGGSATVEVVAGDPERPLHFNPGKRGQTGLSWRQRHGGRASSPRDFQQLWVDAAKEPRKNGQAQAARPAEAQQLILIGGDEQQRPHTNYCVSRVSGTMVEVVSLICFYYVCINVKVCDFKMF